MTDRERWTIYPLLLFSLAISLRDKLLPPAHLQCRQLEIIGEDNKPLIAMGKTPHKSGFVEVMSADGKPRIILTAGDKKSVPTLLQLRDANDKPRFAVGTSGEHTDLQIIGPENHPVLVAGTATDSHAGSLQLLTAQGEIQVSLLSIKGNGVISTVGPEKKPLVELNADTSGAGVLATFGEQGKRLVVLDAANGGGRISSYADDDRPAFAITYDNQGVGRALATDAKGQLYLMLMAPVRINPSGQVNPNAPPATETPQQPETEKAPPGDKKEGEPSPAEPAPAATKEDTSAQASDEPR